MSKRTWIPKDKYYRNLNKPTIKKEIARETYTRPSYRETLKLIKQANNRITKLRQSGIDKGTWAEKKLKNRLQTTKLGAYHRGRIKINPNMTDTQLIAVQKATKQFLESSTSTPKGIKKVEKNTIKAIADTLSDEDSGKISTEDAEFYYDMLGENDFDFFSDKIGTSPLWIIIDESIKENDSENGWIDRLSRYITLNDQDVRDRAIRLYSKYIG